MAADHGVITSVRLPAWPGLFVPIVPDVEIGLANSLASWCWAKTAMLALFDPGIHTGTAARARHPGKGILSDLRNRTSIATTAVPLSPHQRWRVKGRLAPQALCLGQVCVVSRLSRLSRLSWLIHGPVRSCRWRRWCAPAARQTFRDQACTSGCEAAVAHRCDEVVCGRLAPPIQCKG